MHKRYGRQKWEQWNTGNLKTNMVDINPTTWIITWNVNDLNTSTRRQRYMWEYTDDVIDKCQWKDKEARNLSESILETNIPLGYIKQDLLV